MVPLRPSFLLLRFARCVRLLADGRRLLLVARLLLLLVVETRSAFTAIATTVAAVRTLTALAAAVFEIGRAHV